MAKNLLRVFFATDVHGSEVCFKKFLNAATFYEANVLILGGDVTGKLLVPLIRQLDGSYKGYFLGSENVIKPDAIEATEKMLRDSGAYPTRVSPIEYSEMKADKEKSDKMFRDLMIQRLKEWMRMAEERLKDSGIPLYLTGGNDDMFEIENIIRASSYVRNPEGQVVTIGWDYEMVSTGYSNITPWKCPRDIPEEELGRKIEQVVQKVNNFDKCIFNFHVPPYDTPLDIAPKLKDLRPVLSRGGGFEMIHVGSKSVKAAIEKYQPLAGLHGHIHESKAYMRIGKTLCANPGSEYGEGILRGVLINLREEGGIAGRPEFTYG
jgi:hypothetical protein